MIEYNELYEILRKEKYSEALQPLPKNFIEEFSLYLRSNNSLPSKDDLLFSDPGMHTKKQLENAIALFKELILKRKKKILNLVFVATETGIMKRDYENMLAIEKTVFEKLTKSFEEGDKELSKMLSGQQGKEEKHKMILFRENVDQFIDHTGGTIGPFKSGELANLESEVAKILVAGEKADFVEEN
jgi:hypothetical protein